MRRAVAQSRAGTLHNGLSRRTGNVPDKRAKAGFSLLELIVVLVIAGLLAAVVAPRLSGTLVSARLRAGTTDVLATLSRARALAASGGRERSVDLDLSRGEHGVGGEDARRLLPEGIRFSAVAVGDIRKDQGTIRIRFFPDGSAEDAELVLAAPDGGRMRLVVESLTGLAEAGP